MTVSAIVPAYNESDRVAATVAAIRALDGVDEVVVVDDGSRDDTAARAEAAGARVIRLPRNRGKAAALEAGIAAATGDALLLLDADLAQTASEAGVLVDPVRAGDADMTIALFPVIPGRGGGMGLVVRLAREGVARLTGRRLTAPLSGQRCLTRRAIEAALPFATGFGVETALNVAVLRAGLRVVEVPTRMDHRVTQNDWRGRLHRLRQLRDVAKALVSAARRYPWTR